MIIHQQHKTLNNQKIEAYKTISFLITTGKIHQCNGETSLFVQQK